MSTYKPHTQGRNDAAKPVKPRPELLQLAESVGAVITGKPDGSEPITVVFSIPAWRAFDAALVAERDELIEALQTSTAVLHTLPNGETCSCSQCRFVRLRNAAIAKATGGQS